MRPVMQFLLSWHRCWEIQANRLGDSFLVDLYLRSLVIPVWHFFACQNCKGIQQLQSGLQKLSKVLRSSDIFEGDLRCLCQTVHGFAMPLSPLSMVLPLNCILGCRSSLGSFSWSSVGFGSLVEATTRLGLRNFTDANFFFEKKCRSLSQSTLLPQNCYQGGKKSKDFRCVFRT